MTKNLLPIIAISIVNFAIAQDQIVNIPDANFKAYLVGPTAIQKYRYPKHKPTQEL